VRPDDFVSGGEDGDPRAARASAPPGLMNSPGLNCRPVRSIWPERSAYLTIGTASAPWGTGAPVIISMASPVPMARSAGPPAQIPCAHGEAVPDRAGLRRIVPVGADLVGQHTAGRLEQRDHLGLPANARLAQFLDHRRAGLLERKRSHDACFSEVRRTPTRAEALGRSGDRPRTGASAP